MRENAAAAFFACAALPTQPAASIMSSPRVEMGDNSCRNLVSCCQTCNVHKRDLPAADFLRSLHRQRRLTDPELTARLRALDALVAGKLRLRLPQ